MTLFPQNDVEMQKQSDHTAVTVFRLTPAQLSSLTVFVDTHRFVADLTGVTCHLLLPVASSSSGSSSGSSEGSL